MILYRMHVQLPKERLVQARNAQAARNLTSTPAYASVVRDALKCNFEREVETKSVSQMLPFEIDIMNARDNTWTKNGGYSWTKASKYVFRKWGIFGKENGDVFAHSIPYFGLIAFLKATNNFDIPSELTQTVPHKNQTLSRFVSKVFSFVTRENVKIDKETNVFVILMWFFGRLRDTASPDELRKLALLFQAEKEYSFKNDNTKADLSEFVMLVDYSLDCAKEIAANSFQFISPLEVELEKSFKEQGNSWVSVFMNTCEDKDMFSLREENLVAYKTSIIGVGRIFKNFKYFINTFQGFEEALQSGPESTYELINGLFSWLLRRDVSIAENELFPFLCYLVSAYYKAEEYYGETSKLKQECDYERRYFRIPQPHMAVPPVVIQTTPSQIAQTEVNVVDQVGVVAEEDGMTITPEDTVTQVESETPAPVTESNDDMPDPYQPTVQIAQVATTITAPTPAPIETITAPSPAPVEEECEDMPDLDLNQPLPECDMSPINQTEVVSELVENEDIELPEIQESPKMQEFVIEERELPRTEANPKSTEVSELENRNLIQSNDDLEFYSSSPDLQDQVSSGVRDSSSSDLRDSSSSGSPRGVEQEQVLPQTITLPQEQIADAKNSSYVSTNDEEDAETSLNFVPASELEQCVSPVQKEVEKEKSASAAELYSDYNSEECDAFLASMGIEFEEENNMTNRTLLNAEFAESLNEQEIGTLLTEDDMNLYEMPQRIETAETAKPVAKRTTVKKPASEPHVEYFVLEKSRKRKRRTSSEEDSDFAPSNTHPKPKKLNKSKSKSKTPSEPEEEQLTKPKRSSKRKEDASKTKSLPKRKEETPKTKSKTSRKQEEQPAKPKSSSKQEEETEKRRPCLPRRAKKGESSSKK